MFHIIFKFELISRASSLLPSACTLLRLVEPADAGSNDIFCGVAWYSMEKGCGAWG